MRLGFGASCVSHQNFAPEIAAGCLYFVWCRIRDVSNGYLVQLPRPTYNAPMSNPLDVYVFRDGPFAPSGDTVVCVGERAPVEAHLGSGQVQSLFRGSAVYTNDATKQDYIGVWGVRKTSRLRRLLREQGAQLVIHAKPPPGVRLRYFTTSPKGAIPQNQ
jgi:hypothetical protein